MIINLHDHIQSLNEQMAIFVKMRKSALPAEQAALVDALALIETIRINRLPRREICARLRGSALAMQPFSPVITAHMEMIANACDHHP